MSLSLLAAACGGTITDGSDSGADAAKDTGNDAIATCHGYCPQPNGSTCASDCDCYQKCLAGKDTPPTCEDAIVPSIPCGDASACPSGQTCGVFGACEGAPCGTTNQCPAQQTCTAGACKGIPCI